MLARQGDVPNAYALTKKAFEHFYEDSKRSNFLQDRVERIRCQKFESASTSIEEIIVSLKASWQIVQVTVHEIVQI